MSWEEHPSPAEPRVLGHGSWDVLLESLLLSRPLSLQPEQVGVPVLPCSERDGPGRLPTSRGPRGRAKEMGVGGILECGGAQTTPGF